MTYRYHVSYVRQLGNCAPSQSHATINTQRQATSTQDVRAIADLIHQAISADLAAAMSGQGQRHTGTGAVHINQEQRKSPDYKSNVRPNPDLRITIQRLQLL